MTYPVLYSFRRCPYAIRARLALKASGITVCLREVWLRDKPESLLLYSAKATVPVLVLSDQRVIDQSMEIMIWALKQNDDLHWLVKDGEMIAETQRLITCNDNEFKTQLDHYKYADRFPDKSSDDYRAEGEAFVSELETKLLNSPYLLGQHASLADMAILPFIRQFAYVDIDWFKDSPYANLKVWMESLLNDSLFVSVMEKYPQWVEGEQDVLFK